MTSITIYTNEKNYPYVYRLDNPITNEFYIGYRKANLVPAEKDLGTDYFTSAPIIKERFNEFQSTIIAEFFNPNDAYDHEQYLIYCDLGNPKMLNKSCFYGKQRFDTTGKSPSAESLEKSKLTWLEKYGYENPFQAPIIQEKIKQTCLEKYGYENPSQAPIIIEKIKQTLLERTGYEHALQNPGTLEKKKQTLLEQTGYAYAMQNPETKEKQEQTFLEKYGVTNPSQIKFFSIIENQKSYNKASISRLFPELKQYY